MGRNLRSYNTVEEAVGVRCRAAGMSARAARPIVERGLVRDEQGNWRWCSDPRLALASSLKITPNQARAFREAIACPVVMFRFSDGPFRDAPALDVASGLRQVEIVDIAGSHHCHLEDQATTIAAHLARFFVP